jgi:endoglucanase
MNKLALALMLCFLYVNSIAQTGLSAVEKNGVLHVEKGIVVNQYGTPPQLRGISFSWSTWGGRKYYTPEVVDWLKLDFKVNIIRLAMAVEPDHGYLQEPDAQCKLITKLIDRAIKNGIYVLVDWHDHHGNLHTKEASQFFVQIAKRYHGVPNVIYEIWNEPKQTTWDTIKNYALAVIPQIRKYDANNLIIVGSPHWDQDVDIAALDPITNFKNIAYSFHFYASDPRHQEGLRAKGDLAIKRGLPLFVTEWGVGEADGNGQFDKDKNEAWLTWLESNKLSWVNWNLTDKQETTAILLPGANEKGKWEKDQLTAAGIYIRKLITRLN